MKANEIKIIFIKWLLKKYPSSIIGNEVLFSNHQYRTDILQILSNKTHAYEIKSDSDNLENIDQQLQNYLETFDYTSLIFTEKYSNEKINKIDNMVGLYLITKDKKIKKIRQAKISHQIKKENLLCFLHKKELINILNEKGLSQLSVFELRKNARKIPLNIIKTASIDILTHRYSKLLKLFLLDTNGQVITEDDLKSLTGNILTDIIK
jgi:hypothetical protein